MFDWPGLKRSNREGLKWRRNRQSTNDDIGQNGGLQKVQTPAQGWTECHGTPRDIFALANNRKVSVRQVCITEHGRFVLRDVWVRPDGIPKRVKPPKR